MTSSIRQLSPSLFLALAALVASGPVACAAELVMVERSGCGYCARWNAEIAPIYPKTAEGRFAPLRRVRLGDRLPDDLSLATPAVFTPTFILVEAGHEIGRIEGYPGEDFFWGLLGVMLKGAPGWS